MLKRRRMGKARLISRPHERPRRSPPDFDAASRRPSGDGRDIAFRSEPANGQQRFTDYWNGRRCFCRLAEVCDERRASRGARGFVTHHLAESLSRLSGHNGRRGCGSKQRAQPFDRFRLVDLAHGEHDAGCDLEVWICPGRLKKLKPSWIGDPANRDRCAPPDFGMRRLENPPQLRLAVLSRVFQFQEDGDVADVGARQRTALLGAEG